MRGMFFLFKPLLFGVFSHKQLNLILLYSSLSECGTENTCVLLPCSRKVTASCFCSVLPYPRGWRSPFMPPISTFCSRVEGEGGLTDFWYCGESWVVHRLWWGGGTRGKLIPLSSAPWLLWQKIHSSHSSVLPFPFECLLCISFYFA